MSYLEKLIDSKIINYSINLIILEKNPIETNTA